ncbi:NYN domain-containing protein [Arthrobacter sp. CJ23]|uniref:NYN domain-containing protein n=1 Tax=Arthrobacter sp. CJ23 TaxID=2972479 RepID=UPI00215D52C2|nr:NYN domain-containing protein [Arthrobacter sp. CJ23]UVJ40563.1 NYN domain-containing protein [Arthrobacter sp. CJ23]
MEKIAVFLDYSNVHLVGHDLFANHFDRWTTHLSPRMVADRIRGARSNDSELSKIFLYRGSPDRIRDPEATRLFRGEKDRWGADELISATYLPMLYGAGREKPKEAGVDVRLGLDFVKVAEAHNFETIVLFSGDCDLFPAVQDAVKTTTRVELAAWTDGTGTPGNLLSHQAKRDFQLWTHRLTEDDFWDCQGTQSPAAA